MTGGVNHAKGGGLGLAKGDGRRPRGSGTLRETVVSKSEQKQTQLKSRPRPVCTESQCKVSKAMHITGISQPWFAISQWKVMDLLFFVNSRKVPAPKLAVDTRRRFAEQS